MMHRTITKSVVIVLVILLFGLLSHALAQERNILGGAARGAGKGAIIGAIAGDAGKGAAVGAVGGALFGGMERQHTVRILLCVQ